MDRETLAALAEFREELEDRLDRLTPMVKALPDRAMNADPQRVHEIFREVHSLKGAANLLNLTPIASLAHKVEDLLDRVRSGRLDTDQRLRSVIVEVLELIARLGEDLRKVRLVDVGPVIARIDAAVGEGR